MAIGNHQNQSIPFMSSLKLVQEKLADLSIATDSPINNIPFDVLIKIFLSTPRDNVYDRWEIHPPHNGALPRISFHQDSLLDPMILSQVCGDWRKAALSTPLLWSSINILCSDKKQLVPLLKVWLERSDICPLNIAFTESLSGSDTSEIEVNSPTHDLVTLLISQAYRWKTIDFTFARQTPDILSTLAPGSLPLLESASIISRDATNEIFSGEASLEKVWRAIHSSPSFHDGRWEMEYLENNLDEVPWAQLTTIDVTMSLESLIKILPLCHNLLELRYTDPLAVYHPSTLGSQFRSDNEYHPETRIVLSKVKSFSLKMYHPAHTVLDHLTLPALTSYDVQVCKENPERSHASSLKDLLTRSGCCLESLTYDNTEPEAETAVMEILSFSQLSSLVALDVKHRTTDRMIDLLKLTRVGESILPRLEMLFLGPCSTRSGALSGMVLSRLSVIDEIASLRVLEVGRWGHHSLDVECFEILSDEGMYIRV